MAMERAMQRNKKKDKPVGTTSDVVHLRNEAIRLVSYASSIGTMLKNPEVRANLSDEKLTTQRVSVLSRDLHQLHDDLKAIDKLCVGLDLDNVTTDNVMELMQVGEHYHRWLNRYHGAVEPNLRLISKDIEDAINASTSNQKEGQQ